MDTTFRRFGYNTIFVDPDDPENFRRAITEKTKLVYIETIANPRMNVVDIEAVAKIAHDAGVPLVVDNTFASPYLCRPIRARRRHHRPFGNQVYRRTRDFHRRGHRRRRQVRLEQRQVSDVDRAESGLPRHGFHGDFRRDGLHYQVPRGRSARSRPLPGAAEFLFVPAGTGDLGHAHGAPLRQLVGRGQASRRPPVGELGPARGGWNRAPITSRPASICQRAAARCLRSASRAAWKPAENSSTPCSCFPHLANVGDAKSLVIHPASTTHQQLSASDQAAARHHAGHVRLSVGLEDVKI